MVAVNRLLVQRFLAVEVRPYAAGICSSVQKYRGRYEIVDKSMIDVESIVA